MGRKMCHAEQTLKQKQPEKLLIFYSSNLSSSIAVVSTILERALELSQEEKHLNTKSGPNPGSSSHALK